MRYPWWIRKLLKLRTRGVRKVQHYISCSDSTSADRARQAAEAAGFIVSIERLDDPVVYVVTLAHQADPEAPGYEHAMGDWCRDLAATLGDGHYDGLGYDWGYADPPGFRPHSN